MTSPDDTGESQPDLRAALELARSVMRDDAAERWMSTPNPGLGNERPADCVATGRPERVLALLLASAEGVTA